MDFLPTFAEMTGAKLPLALIINKPDGRSIQNLMMGGPDEKTPHDRFYFRDNAAVRSGDWKYREGKRYGMWARPRGTAHPKENPMEQQLYHLADDPGESKNLIELYPEMVSRLKGLLSQTPNRSMTLYEPAPTNGTRYEWEAGTVSGAAKAKDKHVDMHHRKLACAVTIDVDGGSDGGIFQLVLGYAAGWRPTCRLLVNGEEQAILEFPETGSWTTYKAVKLLATLKPGHNNIEIQRLKVQGINFDYLDVQLMQQEAIQ
jgi:hypothetical protein